MPIALIVVFLVFSVTAVVVLTAYAVDRSTARQEHKDNA